MSERKPLIFARVEPEFRQRLKREADARFDGNESMVIRVAARDYLDLRDALGPQYEATLAIFLGKRERVAS